MSEPEAPQPQSPYGPPYPPPYGAPPAPYAPQPQHWYPPPQRTNGFAIASLVLGIIWIYWIGSILALVFGYVAKREIDRSGGRESGRGLAIAGIVLGWIGVGVLILVLVAIAVAVAAGETDWFTETTNDFD